MPAIRHLGIEGNDPHVIARENSTLYPLPEPDIGHRRDLVDAAKRGAFPGGAIGLAGSVVALTVAAAALTVVGGALLANISAWEI